MKKTMNPNSMANLVAPIQKGEVRNPHGRPKGKTLFEEIRKRLEEPDAKKPNQTTNEAMSHIFIQMLREKNERAWVEALNRIDGKPADTLIVKQDDLENIPPDRLQTIRRAIMQNAHTDS